MVPVALLPPATPLTDHLTAVVLVPLSAAVKTCVVPICTDSVAGVIASVAPSACAMNPKQHRHPTNVRRKNAMSTSRLLLLDAACDFVGRARRVTRLWVPSP